MSDPTSAVPPPQRARRRLALTALAVALLAGPVASHAGQPTLMAQAPHGTMSPGHGAHPLPRFINFETGANVKALAMQGRNLWLGMPTGLIRYNVDSYDDHEVFTVAETRRGDRPGLLANGIYAIDVAPDNSLWISTYGGGLTRYDGKDWTTYTPEHGLGDRWAYDVEFDRDGRLWIATWKGLSVLENGRFHTYSEADGLVDKWVYDVEIDRGGLIWCGTEGGVSVFDGTTFTNYTHKDGLGADIPEAERKPVMQSNAAHHQVEGKANQGYNPNYVLGIAIAPDGGKWIGTWGAGLSHFDGKTWKTYTARDGLGGNFIHALQFDAAGTLWAATDGGVSFFKDGRWQTLTTEQGLQDDNVFSLLFEPDGTRWFGTWTGLSKMPPAPPLPEALPYNPHG
ncbi:MAG: hypothetical protein HZA24_03625 [Nitrospirae bacterium]|nr:hypothetical protein [Nitrospirota bacterium]